MYNTHLMGSYESKSELSNVSTHHVWVDESTSGHSTRGRWKILFGIYKREISCAYLCEHPGIKRNFEKGFNLMWIDH